MNSHKADALGKYSKRRSPCNAPSVRRLLKLLNGFMCEPDWEVEITQTPNDTFLSSIYSAGTTAAGRIYSREAWDIATGSHNTVVGIIDTGVDYNHVDLSANMWTNPLEIPSNGIDDDGDGRIDDVHGYDFFNNDSDPMDDHNHGTAVAGVIGAVGNNGLGVVGINWNITMIACKAFNSAGVGSLSAIISCLNYFVVLKRDFGINIVATNNSYGGFPYTDALLNAISATKDQDIVFSTGAGNNASNNDSTPFYPASYDLDNIVVAAATDSTAALTNFSNFGMSSVDIAAPGFGVFTTILNNQYGTYQGTSIATPHITGTIALIRDLYPEYSYGNAIEALLSSGTPIVGLQGKCSTGSLVNVAQALEYVVVPSPTPPPGVDPPPIETPDPPENGGPNLSSAQLEISSSRTPKKFVVQCLLGVIQNATETGLAGYQVSLKVKGVKKVRRAITNDSGVVTFKLRAIPGGKYNVHCQTDLEDTQTQTIKTISSKNIRLKAGR